MRQVQLTERRQPRLLGRQAKVLWVHWRLRTFTVAVAVIVADMSAAAAAAAAAVVAAIAGPIFFTV